MTGKGEGSTNDQCLNYIEIFSIKNPIIHCIISNIGLRIIDVNVKFGMLSVP